MRVLYNKVGYGIKFRNDVLCKYGLGPSKEDASEFIKKFNEHTDKMIEMITLNESTTEYLKTVPKEIKEYSGQQYWKLQSNELLVDAFLRGEQVSDNDNLGVVEFDDAFTEFWYIDDYKGHEKVKVNYALYMYCELMKYSDTMPIREDIEKWHYLSDQSPYQIGYERKLLYPVTEPDWTID
jgi:hypothetical protein